MKNPKNRTGSLVSFGSCNPRLHPQATHTCFGHGVGLRFLGEQTASQFEARFLFFFKKASNLSAFLILSRYVGILIYREKVAVFFGNQSNGKQEDLLFFEGQVVSEL